MPLNSVSVAHFCALQSGDSPVKMLQTQRQPAEARSNTKTKSRRVTESHSNALRRCPSSMQSWCPSLSLRAKSQTTCCAFTTNTASQSRHSLNALCQCTWQSGRARGEGQGDRLLGNSQGIETRLLQDETVTKPFSKR